MSKKSNLWMCSAVLAFSGLASAAVLDLCPGGIFTGSPVGGVVITVSPGNPQCSVMAYVDPAPGGTVSGLGVSGMTGGEIDFGESVTLDFTGLAQGYVFPESFDITVLYNGPEWNDREEQGFVEVTYANNSVAKYTFISAVQPSLTGISWSGFGTATNISPMTMNNAGWFTFGLFPFGVDANQNPLGVKRLTFTAANLPSTGGNNSDYSIKGLVYTEPAIEEIPEPATFAMMGLGLLAVGLLRGRKSA